MKLFILVIAESLATNVLSYSTWSYQSKFRFMSNSSIFIEGIAEKYLYAGSTADQYGVSIYSSVYLQNSWTWSVQAVLQPLAPTSRTSNLAPKVFANSFGNLFQVNDDVILVSSIFSYNYRDIQSGAVYIFNGSFNSWTQQAMLTSGNGNPCK